jgi:light-harvesting complex II chlorophyll a/b binding protein 4
MLAAAGWPMAEIANHDAQLRYFTNGRAPSLFNGHLLDFWPALLVIFGGFAFLEVTTKDKITDGDFGFDPLGIAFGKPRRFASGPVDKPVDKIPYVKKFPGYGMVGDMEKLKLAELKNGRAAMMAITGFAVSEFFWGKPVTELTPIFF